MPCRISTSGWLSSPDRGTGTTGRLVIFSDPGTPSNTANASASRNRRQYAPFFIGIAIRRIDGGAATGSITWRAYARNISLSNLPEITVITRCNGHTNPPDSPLTDPSHQPPCRLAGLRPLHSPGVPAPPRSSSAAAASPGNSAGPSGTAAPSADPPTTAGPPPTSPAGPPPSSGPASNTTPSQPTSATNAITTITRHALPDQLMLEPQITIHKYRPDPHRQEQSPTPITHCRLDTSHTALHFPRHGQQRNLRHARRQGSP